MDSSRIISWIEKVTVKRILWIVAVASVALGVGLRFYHITRSDFVFYDEGYYLSFNRLLGQYLVLRFPDNANDFLQAFTAYLRICLGTGKTLWFLLSDARIFFGKVDLWFWGRVLSAIFGSLTLWLTYKFSKKFYGSASVAFLSVILLAILPSHVFYSRIGLQEALSAFLVLAGFYFYIFPRNLSGRTFVAGIIFGAAFFSNYRLIILPFLILVAEAWQAFALKENFQFRKYLWCSLVYFLCVFGIGSLDNGRNSQVVFSWIFHQGEMAKQEFSWINIFSYPYYLFRLENFIFGLVFLAGNVYLIYRKQFAKLLPFVLVLLQILIFSFTGEKAARYLCAVLPLAVMSVAYVSQCLWCEARAPAQKLVIAAVFVAMFAGLSFKAVMIAQIKSDHRQVVADVLALDPQAKILSTQPYVQNLYVANSKTVESCPHSFEALMQRRSQGFRYLVIDPQAYISWTKDEVRFFSELDGYLGFLLKAARPQRIYSHFSSAMLERFVFEHSENLGRSVEFLNQAKARPLGEIRVYDLSQTVPAVLKLLSQQGRGVYEQSR